MLMEKKLVRVLGRKEIPGRPLIYATTRQFLEMFDLKDLKESADSPRNRSSLESAIRPSPEQAIPFFDTNECEEPIPTKNS